MRPSSRRIDKMDRNIAGHGCRTYLAHGCRLGRQIQVEGQMGRRTWCAQRRARIAGEARTARSSQSKIRLLINPTDSDHQRLSQAIETAFKRSRVEESRQSETDADIETITALAQAILRREWQRVKLGI